MTAEGLLTSPIGLWGSLTIIWKVHQFGEYLYSANLAFLLTPRLLILSGWLAPDLLTPH